MMDTTYTTTKADPISLEDIREAMEKIEPIKHKRIEVSKKHAKKLQEMFGAKDELIDEKGERVFGAGIIGTLYGVEVKVRPYLKKVRIYTEK